jgi:hypothetical protein
MSGVQHIVAAHVSQSLLPVSSATVHEVAASVVEVTSGSADESEVLASGVGVLASVAGALPSSPVVLLLPVVLEEHAPVVTATPAPTIPSAAYQSLIAIALFTLLPEGGGR